VVEGLYLHNEYFKPNKNIRIELNLKEDEEYVVIRFVSWNAHHDVGHAGLDNESKSKLIEVLKPRFKIFISSEGALPKEFEQYKINISPEIMHDVLAEATVFIGESATMASESALLGTQAVYINSLPLMGYLKLEQDSGLLKHFNSSSGVVKYVSEIIMNKNIKILSMEKSENLQKEFINPTKFLAWFIEEFPSSYEIMKETPDYQLNFL
jgi:predicted glycosyltransferase